MDPLPDQQIDELLGFKPEHLTTGGGGDGEGRVGPQPERVDGDGAVDLAVVRRGRDGLGVVLRQGVVDGEVAAYAADRTSCVRHTPRLIARTCYARELVPRDRPPRVVPVLARHRPDGRHRRAGRGFYFTESMKLGIGRRLVLAGLRALVLCAIVFLLCKPVAVRDVKTEKSRPIVILADNSQSMTHKDPRPARRGQGAVRHRQGQAAAEPRHRRAGLGRRLCRATGRRGPTSSRRRSRTSGSTSSASCGRRARCSRSCSARGSAASPTRDDQPWARGAHRRRPEDASHRHRHRVAPARRERPAGRDRPRHRRPRQRQHSPVGRRRPRGRPARGADPRLRHRRLDRGVPAAQGRRHPGHAVRRGHRHRPVPLARPGDQGRRGRADAHARRQGGGVEARAGQGRPGRDRDACPSPRTRTTPRPARRRSSPRSRSCTGTRRWKTASPRWSASPTAR